MNGNLSLVFVIIGAKTGLYIKISQIDHIRLLIVN